MAKQAQDPNKHIETREIGRETYTVQRIDRDTFVREDLIGHTAKVEVVPLGSSSLQRAEYLCSDPNEMPLTASALDRAEMHFLMGLPGRKNMPYRIRVEVIYEERTDLPQDSGNLGGGE